MSIQAIMWDVAETSATIAVLEALKVSDLIQSSNPMVEVAKAGLIWGISDEVIDFLRNGSSALLEGNYYYFVDQVFFNSVVYGAIERLGVGERVLDVTDGLPFGSANNAVATGIMKVSAKTLAQIIDQYYDNTPLGMLTSVTRNIRQ
jgi:hypothetical protein